MEHFEPLFHQLRDDGVRYLVVGGLALVLLGLSKHTADIDIMVALDPASARRAIDSLLAFGLRPRAPVDPYDFAREDIRQSWVADKGMSVLSFWHPKSSALEVDVFAFHPIDFERALERAALVPVAGTFVPVAHLDDLLELKRLAQRRLR